MNTGEDAQGLRKIVDFTRFISVVILGIHFYIFCYEVFNEWSLTAEITDRTILNISKTAVFNKMMNAKLASLLFLAISLIGLKGKKDENMELKSISKYLLSGLVLYFASGLFFYLPLAPKAVSILYIGVTVIGFLLVLSSGAMLSRLIHEKLDKDIFNDENETFPQEERLLENEYSINLPAKYRSKNKTRDSWINLSIHFVGCWLQERQVLENHIL
jgi:hypothetical protein